MKDVETDNEPGSSSSVLSASSGRSGLVFLNIFPTGIHNRS